MPFYTLQLGSTLMSVPCEIAVKCVLPVVRAMIAKQLTTQYQLKQTDTARLLGLSQPAISLYYRKLRGKAIDLENDHDINNLIKNMAKSLAEDKLSRQHLIMMYCQTCRTIRAKGLLCRLHKTFDPTIETENCELCKTDFVKCP
jgi:predicted transcriptional regulator